MGEFIQIVGVQGEVAVIELFSTTLRHADHSRIIIPNRKLVGEILHNYGTMRQLSLSVTVPHGTDLSAALSTVADLVQRNARVLKEPPPVIGVGQVLDGGVKLAIGPWVRVPDVGPADSELYQALVRAVRHTQHSVRDRADRRPRAERRADGVSARRGRQPPRG